MTPARDASRDATRRRLVVVPLSNISPNPDDAYFADGMTEELISTLSRLRELRTLARTSAMQFKGTGKSVAEIRRELQVSHVLEGSVRVSGKKLRISLQLVDATTEEPLWSETYDRDLEDVFAIQREVARRVARALKLRVARSDAEQLDRPTTGVVDAYTLYLQGRANWNLRTESGLREAVRGFEQAIEKDPNFALAHAGLADANAALAALEFDAPRDAFPRASEAATRALALDPMSPEAHAALGLVRFQYERDWVGAERELRRAVELNANYPAAHQYLADYLKAMGRFAEATDEMRSALELDPLSLAIATGLGHVLYLSRQYDAAIEQYRRALSLDPKFVLAHLWFGRPFLETGRFDEAIAEVRQAVQLSQGSSMSLAVLAHALASAGRAEEAKRILAELLERAKTRYLPSYWIAFVHAGLGDAPSAVAWLERAFDERSAWLVWIGVEPRFDRLRSDPGFRSLIAQLRLPGPPAHSGAGSPRATADEARHFLAHLEEVNFRRFQVVGEYVRYAEPVRQRLKDLRQRIAHRFETGAIGRENLLIWGAPGSGKTFFVREVAASLPGAVHLKELNLAETGEAEFRAALAGFRSTNEPMLVFVDEVDSKPTEPWPYEAMLPSLDLGVRTPAPVAFVLAGSAGSDLETMKHSIAARPKGVDLLSRIPHENEFVIDPLSPEDRVLVAAGNVATAARRNGRTISEVEKLALYYLAVQPDLANPRQLRDRVATALGRLPAGEERLKFDLLFHAGDPLNKEFWVEARGAAPELINAFVALEVGSAAPSRSPRSRRRAPEQSAGSAPAGSGAPR